MKVQKVRSTFFHAAQTRHDLLRFLCTNKEKEEKIKQITKKTRELYESLRKMSNFSDDLYLDTAINKYISSYTLLILNSKSDSVQNNAPIIIFVTFLNDLKACPSLKLLNLNNTELTRIEGGTVMKLANDIITEKSIPE